MVGLAPAGQFHSVAHETKGTAVGARARRRQPGAAPDRLHDVQRPRRARLPDRGPDASDNATVTKSGYLELGKLKGNEGDQNYEIPAGTDLDQVPRGHDLVLPVQRQLRHGATHPGFLNRRRSCRSLAQCRSRSRSWRSPRGSGQGAAPAATKFTIRVENISNGEVLKLSNGKTAPFVSAPVLWAVHTGSANPIFVGWRGRTPAKGLETLAETGNPEPLAKSLGGTTGIVAVGADDHPVGCDAGGPIPPGKGYEFEVDRGARADALARVDVRPVERPVLLQRPADRPVRRRGQAGRRRHDARSSRCGMPAPR